MPAANTSPPVPMSNLLRLVYVSRPTRPVDEAFMEELLSQARTSNQLLGITGVLCSGRGYFVQVLEGQEGTLLTLYARILADTRHEQASLLSIGLSAKRAFSQWSMACIDGEALSPEIHTRLVSKALVDSDMSEQARLLQTALTTLRRAA
ncbi:MAG: BLUF domain-containing protein [Methylibium sp.]|nr:BLUF domain-containing protein [Methylibium sp.]